ncbi:UNVERIFIED_CONTAM: putative alpha,alpha-trehalose-phosphate synthase [UDP-forming] 10 [Sesamum calycinum]|uniref:Alpha,alpha-trehalose-phosphate synthase [UDP-forming] 10 n=1 Tax=Sesamum calycinum TaxID=2727403 RepID=A0AAW2PNX9_9LAMI
MVENWSLFALLWVGWFKLRRSLSRLIGNRGDSLFSDPDNGLRFALGLLIHLFWQLFTCFLEVQLLGVPCLKNSVRVPLIMMASRSCGNFLDLASGGMLDVSQTPRGLPRVMTLPGIISDGNGSSDADSDSTSTVCPERKIIVANMLPLQAQKDPGTGKWRFSLDEDSILLQSKDGFSPETEKKFYYGFCKQQLWPLFHYMLPMCTDHGDRFDRQLWQAYVSANKVFADKVMEIANPEDDFIWIHDYHLMVLPTFLRKRYNRVKLGFFLHSPFPSSEIYRTLPVRDEILKGLLNSDLIGFHTFDYARHFLSCCGRMLGLDYESKRGHIGLDYFGRTVYIKILPVGISLKLLAFEQLLEQQKELQGKLVLVQIVNPARSSGKDVQEAKKETYLTAKRINEVYGCADYEPVQGSSSMDQLWVKPDCPRTSMLVCRVFIGCSPSLSGAIRVNPWDIDAVAEAMNTAITT